MQKFLTLAMILVLLAGCATTATNPSDDEKVIYPPAPKKPDAPVAAAPKTASNPVKPATPALNSPQTPAPALVPTPPAIPAPKVEKLDPAKEAEAAKLAAAAKEEKKAAAEAKDAMAKDAALAKKEANEKESGAKKSDKKKGTWHLRIIALPYHEHYKDKIEKIVNFLKEEQGIDAVVARMSESKEDKKKLWVIDIGSFESPKSQEAAALLKKIHEMSYDKTKQFQDAYYTNY